MSQGPRPERVGDQLRDELADLLRREVHDPGLGFVTLTRVHVSPDLQVARVYYSALGDDAARRKTAHALERAASFLRRHIGSRLRLRRVPELTFIYDDSIAGQDRIEQILSELRTQSAGGEPVNAAGEEAPDSPSPSSASAESSEARAKSLRKRASGEP